MCDKDKIAHIYGNAEETLLAKAALVHKTPKNDPERKEQKDQAHRIAAIMARPDSDQREPYKLYFEGEAYEIHRLHLFRIMKQLPRKQLAVLILHFWRNMTFTEIAEKLGIARKTVYNRREAAYAIIRDYYGGMKFEK